MSGAWRRRRGRSPTRWPPARWRWSGNSDCRRSGALAAAAAHELGTPLGTIHLVAKELASEIPPDSPLSEDIALLQSQSLRCRDILAELSRKPEAEGGEPFDRLTVPALIEAAGAPHRLGHIQFILETDPVAGPPCR